MAVANVHLMLVNLNLTDEPVGYSPPVGPSVRFVVRYSHRDAFQPATFTYPTFGPKWTHDWLSYIADNPQSPSADVDCYLQGGGVSTFTGFNPSTQTYAYEQYDQTRLKRTGPASYEMTSRDGSQLVFSQPDGLIGTTRRVFLTQVIDPLGNAVTLTYDDDLRVTDITDAIGQVTTLSYDNTNDLYKITRVTDPFGRFASFDYDPLGRLTNITDVIGLTSAFQYETNSDFINALITPYGTTTFLRGTNGTTTRWLETIYPDGSRDRVEFNQSTNLGIAFSEPLGSVPQGMATFNEYLYYRNTYYWSRTACATVYGDYTKANIYHWLHTADLATCSGILESDKEPLEGRVWYGYGGQTHPAFVGSSGLPAHVGRVLDDSTTQLHTYGYTGFWNLTNRVDPMGRTFSYLYADNGIDLLEIRMTRAGKNELLFRSTYNAQHLPLTRTDGAGQTTIFTYNARGQVLTQTNPKGETTAFTYDANGYLTMIDGPLPGTNDSVMVTYDAFGRMQTRTDESGHTVVLEYDDLDRVTKVTHPDGTFEQLTYDRLDQVIFRDRAGRQTFLKYDSLRQLTKQTDPINRTTFFQWCACGDLGGLTDPMGRTTLWHRDLQGRLIGKEYGDGSQIRYSHENRTSRLRQIVDEKQQVTQYAYNRDDSLHTISYVNTAVPTPGLSFTYDPDHKRRISMTDGLGTTVYAYIPYSVPPVLGAGQLASVDGPLPNDTITYSYDQLGRRVSTAINGVARAMTYDVTGRIIGQSNALGNFAYSYDGNSDRLVSETFPNGLTNTRTYGSDLEDEALQQIAHQVGAVSISKFVYTYDTPEARIKTWSQQVGAQAPSLFTFGYDAADQLIAATVTNAGLPAKSFAYAYDPAGNRLTEQADASISTAYFNALNQLSTTTGESGASRTNEWDGEHQLAAVISGNQRTEFAYDGLGRLAQIRQLVDGAEVSNRRFVWCEEEICEERTGAGAVTKRFFDQGVRIESGPNPGNYYYTRDHLGTVRELLDSAGVVRARYTYDPWGRRTRTVGDLETDFAFAGMFWAAEAGLSITHYRAYDPGIGRWLSRDPLEDAELEEGPNLYAYVANDPVNGFDPLGLCDCTDEKLWYEEMIRDPITACQDAYEVALEVWKSKSEALEFALLACKGIDDDVQAAKIAYENCLKTCQPKKPPQKPKTPPKHKKHKRPNKPKPKKPCDKSKLIDL